MQLALDAADRLVELVAERRGPVPAEEAARALFALERAPVGLARELLDDVVRSDARLQWGSGAVRLAGDDRLADPLEAARYVVVDVETTGLSPARSSLCEIGAVRIESLAAVAEFQTLVNPGCALPQPVGVLTGLTDRELRRAPAPAAAVRRFLAFAGDCVLVAHNARFDLGFLDREVERLAGRRIAAPVVDTVWLARRLLAGRLSRVSLASLAHFFGTETRPCHRALPDAQATAEVLLALLGLAQERGAASVGDICELASPRRRRVHAKRELVRGAPPRPGVYEFRDAQDNVLYLGRARDLRARLRSYFSTERQRPAVEAALDALARVEWRELGSELEAAIVELRLLRELRPPANVRNTRPDRHVYLRRRGDSVVVSSARGEWGPVRGRRRAGLAARALAGASDEELAKLAAGAPLPRLRRRLARLAAAQRYEDAARLRDRIQALERVVAELAELERLRSLEACLLVPALTPGFMVAYVVCGGRIAASRPLAPGAGARIELAAAIEEGRRAAPSVSAEDADELLVLSSFLRRPPPELRVLPLPAAARLAA